MAVVFAKQERSEADLFIQEGEGGLGFQRTAMDTSSRVTILRCTQGRKT